MKKILYILAVALSCQIAYAQGFDPTVEVSRTYESTLRHTPKPVPSMAVPDSLLRFDLDFDYSVFDRPFKGTGDYKPYLLDLRPQPDAYRGKKLYLKGGLGYTLHPELDFVYAPEVGNNSDLNIYAQHRSYFGKYKYSDAFNANGHDSYTKAGVNGKTGLGALDLLYNANYLGIHTKDVFNRSSSLNGLEAMLGVRSTNDSDIFYSAAINLDFEGDKLSYNEKSLGIMHLGFDGGIGKVFSDYTLAADVHFSRSSYSFNGLKSNVGNWYIAPRYITEKDGFRLNLGVKLGSVMGSEHSWFNVDLPVKIHKSQVIYPDLHVAYELDPGAMDFFADLTGGDDLPGYQDIRFRDHMALPLYTDNSLVRFDFDAGLRGNISRVFRYDVALGFRSVGHMGLYAMTSGYYSIKVYENVTEPYLKGAFAYDCKPVLLEGQVVFKGTSLSKSSKDLSSDYNSYQVFTPRAFTAKLQAMYFWKSRIKGGVTATFGSRIKGTVDAEDAGYGGPWGILPKEGFDGFVDIALVGEYSVDRTVSVYGRVGNLLNKKYFNDNLVPVSGLFVTAGIIINL